MGDQLGDVCALLAIHWALAHLQGGTRHASLATMAMLVLNIIQFSYGDCGCDEHNEGGSQRKWNDTAGSSLSSRQGSAQTADSTPGGGPTLPTHPLILLHSTGYACPDPKHDHEAPQRPKRAWEAAGVKAGVDVLEARHVAGKGPSTVPVKHCALCCCQPKWSCCSWVVMPAAGGVPCSQPGLRSQPVSVH